MNKILICNIVLILALLGMSLYVVSLKNGQGFFAQVPIEELHTMRVWEDGSYEIVYQDNTSELGCLPTGLCKGGIN